MFYDISGKVFFEMEANEDEDKLAIGKYLFSAGAFEKANQILSNAGNRNDTDYLVIDEIGPLEIKQQKGLHKSFTAILSSTFNYTLIIVVRRPLVEEITKTFSLSNINVMTVEDMKERFKITP